MAARRLDVVRKKRRTTATFLSLTWFQWLLIRAWIDELRSTLPEPPLQRRQRLRKEWGISEHEMQSLVNAGGVELVEATIALGLTKPGEEMVDWGDCSTRQRGLGRHRRAPITPSDVARIVELTSDGSLNDKLARQVIEGVLAGEGSPDDVVKSRGLAVVSDDAALLAAIDAALAQQPEVAEKIRAGKLQAAGAIVGAVMKSTGGQADAARVRELILERLG